MSRRRKVLTGREARRAKEREAGASGARTPPPLADDLLALVADQAVRSPEPRVVRPELGRLAEMADSIERGRRAPLDALALIREMRSELRHLEGVYVVEARRRGYSWSRIGTPLLKSAQAVHRMWAPHVPPGAGAEPQ